MNREKERGSAMLVTLVLIAALIGGAAVVVSMQLASTKSADITKTGMSSLAETLQRVSTAAYQAASAAGGDDGAGDGAGATNGSGAEEPSASTSDEETVEGEFKEV